MKKAMKKALIFVMATHMLAAHAECVIAVKTKTNVQILGQHTMLLTGGVGSPVIIRSFAFFYPNSSVMVLKDSFCDYDNNAIAVDNQVISLQQVESVN